MRMLGRSICCLAALWLSVGMSQAREPEQDQDVEVAVEVKFVVVDQSAADKLKQQGLLKESKGKKIASLDKKQMSRFLEVAQNDIHCNVLQAPKITMANDQLVVCNLGDEHHCVTGLEIVSRNGQIEYIPKEETIPLGPQVRIRSHVSADRRRVRVHVNAKVNHLDSPKVPRFRITTPDLNNESGTVTHSIEMPKISSYGVKRTMVIPDGKTAVLPGGTYRCVQATVSKVPMVSDIPLMGKLFRNVSYEEQQQHLLVLVTPCILVSEEDEEPSEISGSKTMYSSPAEASHSQGEKVKTAERKR